jgi:hypothetical protein
MVNPQGSGAAAVASQTVSEDLMPLVETFVKSTGWRGLFMVELLRDSGGTVWFVEFNGRPWGSMALARRCGLEYPAWTVNLTLNPRWQPDAPRLPERSIVCRHMGRDWVHLLFLLRGPQSKAITDWPPFWRTLFEVLRLPQRDSLYNWRSDDKHVFFADCWYTMYKSVFRS